MAADKQKKLRICLVCLEIFAWGKYGGFGRATRTIGRELAAGGLEVFAVVPRRPGQGLREILDGITVLSYPQYAPWEAIPLFRQIDADVYHSQEPSTATVLAQWAMPRARHVVTFRDTRLWGDWLVELRHPSRRKFQVLLNYLFENNFLVTGAIRRADSRHCAAEFLAEKAAAKYKLPVAPTFLPTPVTVPERIVKAEQPTVCFIGRWDRVKRPELFLALASEFPDVRFIAVGRAQDPEKDRFLREKFSGLPNLELPGMIDQFASDGISRILEKSWILVNTSAKEALPNSFVEAIAHKCAILSSLDPDNFTSRFGRLVRNEDYAAGLRELLQADVWKECGEQGYRFVLQTFERSAAVRRHREVYDRLLSRRRGDSGPQDS